MATPHNVAVILAGGLGTRVGQAVPKQLLTIGGQPIINHAIGAFSASDAVDDIVVVMVEQHLREVRDSVRERGLAKVTDIIAGGSTRTESTGAALRAIEAKYREPDAINVLIHDAARPMVSAQVIADVIDRLTDFAAVTPVVELADTVAEVENGRVCGVLDRSVLRRVQTPQGFRLPVLLRAYELASKDPDFVATDDCSVVLRYLPEVDIAVVAGSERNLKITQPIDLTVAEALLDQSPQ